MELNTKMYNDTNEVIDNIGFDQNNERGISKVVRKLDTIRNRLSDQDRLSTLEKYDFFDIANDINDVKNNIQMMNKAGVLDYNQREEEMSRKANDQLLTMLKSENVDEISMKELMENFFNCWNKIFIELIDPENYDFKKSKEWWEYLWVFIFTLYTTLTKEDRLIYVGVGLIILSFFFYFIFVTS
jgi:hypothetical protein